MVDIQKLATIHHELSIVIKLINKIYSPLIMLYFGGIFCLFNLFLFSLVITSSYYNDFTQFTIMLVANAEWSCYDVAIVFIVICTSTKASNEAKRTANLIHKILNTSTDDQLIERVSQVKDLSHLFDEFYSHFFFPFSVDELQSTNFIWPVWFFLWTFHVQLEAQL